jgi:Family of unknown function (DUF6399)
MATKVRAAHTALTASKARLEQVQAPLQTAGDEPQEHGPGRPPKETMRREHAQQALVAASREHERLAQHREQVTRSIRAIGQASQFVALERGVRRNGKLIAADLHGHIETIRAVAHQESLRQTCLARIDKAERVVPKMQATIEFVSGYGREQVRQLDLTPLASYSMHAHLLPSFYLERVAQTRTVSAGEPLRELAERLRAPLCESGGACSELREAQQSQLNQQAKELAEVFQRSRSKVEGRNGCLSLRNHQLRGLDLPRKRECLTAIHNFFRTRSDGTTAAERFFSRKLRCMFTAILDSVELQPAPLSPPRRP